MNECEQLFRELTTAIRREMNGAVSGAMRVLDPQHQRKINFGVSLPTIKSICSRYGKSHIIAEELRKYDIREWWLASAVIDDPTLLTVEDFDNISSRWINEEEANVFAMELISFSPHRYEISLKWLKGSSHLRRKAAERTVMRFASEIDDHQANEILELTDAEGPVRTIYQYHRDLRDAINQKGPYEFSWQLREIDQQ